MMSLVFQRYGYERFDGEVPDDETGDASTAEVLLAQAMADHADDDGGNIYPSLRKLARKSRQSVSSVRRYIKLMVAFGWLIRVNAGVGGRGNTNEYRINPDWIKGANLTPFAARRKHFTEKGFEAPLDPSLEPSRAPENPSTAVEPFAGEKGSSLNTFPPERVSNQGLKGVTAVAPESSEPMNQEARAPARGSARPRGTEPEASRPSKPTAADILRQWQQLVRNDLETEIQRLMFDRRAPIRRGWPNWPVDLRRLAESALDEIADRFANIEISRGARSPTMEPGMRRDVASAAPGVVAAFVQQQEMAA